MIVGLILMLVVVVGSFNLSYIFLTSTFLILCTVYFTLFFSRNLKQCKPSHKKAEKEILNHEAHIIYGDWSVNSKEDHESGNVARSSFLFKDEGQISDEDALIELQLPAGHYLSPYEYQFEQKKISFNQKLVPDCYYCKRNHQQAWIELLSEEDDLIEIDISIGSIMCPRFETEAPLVF